MRSEKIRRRTVCLTLSALLAALGVVLLALGSLFETLDLSMAALASFFCIYAVIEMRGGYPWMIWIVTAGLAFLLLPQKTPALFYVFIGHYPMVKALVERLPRLVSWVVKLVWLHLSGALIFVTARFLLAPAAEWDSRAWYWILLYFGVLVAFVLFDLALTRIISFYLVRLQKRMGIR